MFKNPFKKVIPNKPLWLLKAESYEGLQEIKGPQHNPEILDFWKSIKLGGIKNDETAWCAAFVGACLEKVGIKSTRSESARSYEKYGVKLEGPAVGCIVTFWRTNPNSHEGHVGYVEGKDKNGNLIVLGGNQADAVNKKPFSVTRVLSYSWPEGVELPTEVGFDALPVININAKLSTNEA